MVLILMPKDLARFSALVMNFDRYLNLGSPGNDSNRLHSTVGLKSSQLCCSDNVGTSENKTISGSSKSHINVSPDFGIQKSEDERGCLERQLTSDFCQETEIRFLSNCNNSNITVQSHDLVSSPEKLPVVCEPREEVPTKSALLLQLKPETRKTTDNAEGCKIDDNDLSEKWTFMQKRSCMLQSKVDFEGKHFHKLDKKMMLLGDSFFDSQLPLAYCAQLLACTEKLVEQKRYYCCQVCYRDTLSKRSAILPEQQKCNLKQIKANVKNTVQVTKTIDLIESENEPLWMQNFQPRKSDASSSLKPVFESPELRMAAVQQSHGDYWDSNSASQLLREFNQPNQCSDDSAAKQKLSRMIRTPLYPDPK